MKRRTAAAVSVFTRKKCTERAARIAIAIMWSNRPAHLCEWSSRRRSFFHRQLSTLEYGRGATDFPYARIDRYRFIAKRCTHWSTTSIYIRGRMRKRENNVALGFICSCGRPPFRFYAFNCFSFNEARSPSGPRFINPPSRLIDQSCSESPICLAAPRRDENDRCTFA